MLGGRLRVGAQGFDVEGDGEAFLRAGEVEQGRADDAVEHGVGVVERGGAAAEAVEELLVLVKGSEERALAEEEIDVAGEAGGGLVWREVEIEVEVLTEVGNLIGGEGPGVAFGSKDGGAGGVEGTQGVHKRWELLGLREMVEVVGVLTEIDELGGVRESAGLGGCRVGRPGDYQDGVFRGALNGPFG